MSSGAAAAAAAAALSTPSAVASEAVAVRERVLQLGKSLVSLGSPQTIMIVAKVMDGQVVEFTRQLACFLIDRSQQLNQPLTVFVDEQLRLHQVFKQIHQKPQSPYKDSLLYWTPKLCQESPEKIHLIITLGGDGTVLYVSWLFQNSQVPPVVPFHLGSLGFLTNFNVESIRDVLETIIFNMSSSVRPPSSPTTAAVGVRVNMRTRLCCTVWTAANRQFSSSSPSISSSSSVSLTSFPGSLGNAVTQHQNSENELDETCQEKNALATAASHLSMDLLSPPVTLTAHHPSNNTTNTTEALNAGDDQLGAFSSNLSLSDKRFTTQAGNTQSRDHSSSNVSLNSDTNIDVPVRRPMRYRNSNENLILSPNNGRRVNQIARSPSDSFIAGGTLSAKQNKHVNSLNNNNNINSFAPMRLAPLPVNNIDEVTEKLCRIGATLPCRMDSALASSSFLQSPSTVTAKAASNSNNIKLSSPLVEDAPCSKEFPEDPQHIPIESFYILNDLVVDRGPSPYMSQLELFVDDVPLTTINADGLVVATPTGSTAYSLSAGASLTHPEVPAILVTPICPHTLSFRPMLLPDSFTLKIEVPIDSRSTAWASFDGRHRIELKQGDFITVTSGVYPMPTVCRMDQSEDWFQSLRRCLHWNERTRQKPFHNNSTNTTSAKDSKI